MKLEESGSLRSRMEGGWTWLVMEAWKEAKERLGTQRGGLFLC